MSGDRSGTREDGAWRAGMEAETRDLRRAVDVLFGKVDAQSGKLDAITTALHELRGAAGPSLKDMVIIITALAGLFSAAAGGIIYLSRGGNSEALHQLELRIQRIETVLSLSLKRTSGTAWTPDRAGW